MEFRYHHDPETGLPHIYGHGIAEQEVEEVMRGGGDDFAGSEDSRMKIGKTAAGRLLQLIYVPDDDRQGVFIVTAYEPTPKGKKAFRRRKRRKGK
jgi:hypothetical protein